MTLKTRSRRDQKACGVTNHPPIRLRCSLGRQPIHALKVLLKTKGRANPRNDCLGVTRVIAFTA